MELRQTLIDVSNDARSWLKAWAKGFSDEEAVRSSGDLNPLAWQLGHLACSEDDVRRLFTGAERVAPEGVHVLCGMGAGPPAPDASYPSLAELWRILDRTHAAWLDVVSRVDDGGFDKPPRTENPYFRTLGQAVYELALHENYHVGMIGALRKGLGKGSPS